MEMDRVGNVRQVAIEDEMRTAYIDYAMSVIVARALPDVRDGLKPVHRRILYTMHEMGLRSTAAYRKCAGVVGEAMAKYHPHGDLALYETLVRMAQDFSLRYPLVDGQGNFGSVDGDPPAAMRYTEARMASITDEMLGDIEKETVDFVDNYDGRLRQPTVLPSKLPNLLVNGSSRDRGRHGDQHPAAQPRRGVRGDPRADRQPGDDGRRAGRASSTGPTSPPAARSSATRISATRSPARSERVDAIRHLYATGRGRIIMRGQVAFEEVRGGMAVVVTELPYQVNKTTLIEKMADLVASKKITDVRDIRDESDRDGMRIVVEVKRDGSPHTVMQQLFKHTQLQTSFNANMLALVDGQPQTLGLKKMLEHYIAYRREVVRRRTEFDLARAQERAHILEGLKIALDNLDEVIATIRAAADVDAARSALIKKFSLTEVQANAILEMQLRRLAALERKKIEDEYRSIIKLISELEDLLANPRKILPGHQGRARRSREALRRRPQDAHPGRCEPRADRGGPRGIRGRRRHPQPARLHQAPADRDLPLAAPRRPGQAGHADPRGGRGAPPAWWRTRTTTSCSSPTADASSSPRSTPCPTRHARRRGCRSSTCRACRWSSASTSAPSSACRSSSRGTTWSWRRARA